MVVAALVALLIVGCGSVTDAMTAASRSAAAATSGAGLAVSLYDHSGATASATDTALSDALTQLEAAQKDAVEAQPTTADESSRRESALIAIRTATDAVVAAREALASGVQPDPSALESAAHMLQELGR